MCYYFDDIINGTKIKFSNILFSKKLYGNISVYSISHKTPTGPKRLHTKLDKIDGFIISLDGKIKHLTLFDYRMFNKICDKIKYLISKKSDIINNINHNFGKIRIDSYNSLPINFIILIKSVVHKNENKYCHNIFLEKSLYKDK